MGDSAILGANGKPYAIHVKDTVGDDTFSKDGTYEKNEHGGFTADFVNGLRQAVSESQGMTRVVDHYWYFPDAKGSFARLTATDLDNYYRKAYTEAEREEHARELTTLRKQARAAKSLAMKGSDALVPHMWIPFKVGHALEMQFPDEFSSRVRNDRAMAILEGLMPDWVLVPQFTRRASA